MAIKLSQALLLIGIGLKIVLLFRIYRLDLAKRFPMLTLCLAFSAFRTSGTFLLLQVENLEAASWLHVVTQPMLWALYFLVVSEFYSLMLADFPGLRRLSRIFFYSAVAGATLGCCILVMLEQQAGAVDHPVLGYLIVQDRSIFLCLSVLMALFYLFLSFYRIQVRRNLLVVSACFGGYFISSSVLAAVFRYLGGSFTSVRNLANSFFYLAALSCASVWLSRAGELQTCTPRLPGKADRKLELVLVGQLHDFNYVLGRVLRRW